MAHVAELLAPFYNLVEYDDIQSRTEFNTEESKVLSSKRNCAGVPNDTKTGNLTYVFPRQLQLIINFPGKIYPLFTASKIDFSCIKLPARYTENFQYLARKMTICLFPSQHLRLTFKIASKALACEKLLQPEHWIALRTNILFSDQ